MAESIGQEIRALLRSGREHLHGLLTSPLDELTRAQRSLRFAIELARHGARELRRNRAKQMAAALTYRTIFSLVPVAALALLTFRAAGGIEEIRGELQPRLYEFLGLSSIVVDAPGTPEGEDAGGDASQELRITIDRVLADLVDRASGVKLQSLGTFGALLFIWAALALVIEVEHSFNRIYNCPSGRSWYRRLTLYWTLITLGPVLILVSFNVLGRVGAQLGDEGLSALWSGRLHALTALMASWLLFLLLYRWVPNTKVRLRPALVGAFVAAALWELGKALFKLYVTRALPYSALYGALGLIPLFLLWVYLTWLIVLFGLEIAYTLQAMSEGRFKQLPQRQQPDLLADPRWVVPLMQRIAHGFKRGEALSATRLARELELPVDDVSRLTQLLEHNGLLHEVAGERGDSAGYVLARPPEAIALAQLLELAASLSRPPRHARAEQAWQLVAELEQAGSATVGERSLASLLQ